MKIKNLYVARIKVDDDLIAMLSEPRTGRLEVWNLESKGVSWSSYLYVPDFSGTDEFTFDVLFDDDFRADNDVRIGSRFTMSIQSYRKTEYEIEIIDIKKGDPINNLENKRIVNQSTSMIEDYLSIALYKEIGVKHDQDGWFDVDEIISNMSLFGNFDFRTLELIVNTDEDKRYIFSDDKTKLRINPEHLAPRNVEELLKTAGNLKIKRSAFIKNNLPFVKDKKRSIAVECSDGNVWKFPYVTNKIFVIDDKRFFTIGELDGKTLMSVSSYMAKRIDCQYRMVFVDVPGVINNIFPIDAELSDYEDNIYKVSIS